MLYFFLPTVNANLYLICEITSHNTAAMLTAINIKLMPYVNACLLYCCRGFQRKVKISWSINILVSVKKGLAIVCTVFLIISSLYSILLLLNSVFLKLAYAQVPQDTFSAGGIIQTQFAGINNQPLTNQSSSSALGGANATNSSVSNTPITTVHPSLYRVNGTWDVVVNNGDVTNFKAIAGVSPINKTSNSNISNHTYEISNFHNGNKMYAQLYPNGVAFIVGKSDIMEDGASKWKDIHTALIIDKASSFKISLDPIASGNLFNGQPLQGLTTSIKNSQGMELLNNKGSSPAGPQESGPGPGSGSGPDSCGPAGDEPLLLRSSIP